MRENTRIKELIDSIANVQSEFAKIQESKYDSFREEIKTRFGFEKEFGWNILHNAITVFEDTEMAKSSYFNSEYSELGERYLRLYGLLSAIYLQYNVIINLGNIFHVYSPKELKRELDRYNIIQLRHKASSHSSNYLHNDFNSESKTNVYEISQHELEYERIVLERNQRDFENYDLVKDIADFDSKVITILLMIKSKLDDLVHEIDV